MSLRLMQLSNVKTKGQQQIFKAYGFSIKRVAVGEGEYQSRITFNVKLNHASPKTVLKQ